MKSDKSPSEAISVAEHTKICDALQARVERLEGALEWMLPILQDAATVPRIKDAPETPLVRGLGERFGYGAVMDAASALWVEVLEQKRYPSGGAFTPGLSLGVADLMLTRARAALADKGEPAP